MRRSGKPSLLPSSNLSPTPLNHHWAAAADMVDLLVEVAYRLNVYLVISGLIILSIFIPRLTNSESRIKELYYTPGQSEHPQEAGWVLMNLTPPDEKGLRNIDNFTGVIMVQRDLWYPTYLDL